MHKKKKHNGNRENSQKRISLKYTDRMRRNLRNRNHSAPNPAAIAKIEKEGNKTQVSTPNMMMRKKGKKTR